MADDKTFDPGRYLTKVSGSDYLEVKWRIVWFKELHGDAGAIESELIAYTDKTAICKATVKIGGVVVATDIGSESYDDFRDFHEKASTKAIGRALALAGFGTQFTPDHDFGAASGAVVDSPVNRGAAGRPAAPPNGQRPTIANPAAPASPAQINFIRGLAKECGYVATGPDGADHLDEIGFAAFVGARYQSDWPSITKGTASALIEQLQEERATRKTAASGGADRWTS